MGPVPHREIFFGGSVHEYGWIIYILASLAVAALAYSFYRRSRLWKLGSRDGTFSDLRQKTKSFIATALIDGFLHRKILRDVYPGTIHALIFWGAMFLLLATTLDPISYYIVHFMEGNTYLAISFLADLGGLMILVGLVMVVIRRYIQKPDRLDNIPADAIGLALIFILVLSGFILEGLRMQVTAAASTDPIMEWARWSFLGFGFAKAFEGGSNLMGWYEGIWWVHSILVVGAIFYIAIAFPKLTHMLVSPINAFFRTTGPRGALRSIDLEQAETFGAASIQHFTFKDLLDLDACTQIGRAHV